MLYVEDFFSSIEKCAGTEIIIDSSMGLLLFGCKALLLFAEEDEVAAIFRDRLSLLLDDFFFRLNRLPPLG